MTDPTDPIAARYGTTIDAPEEAAALDGMLRRGSCRAYRAEALAPEVLDCLAAAALASPTKSDLQQRDILFVENPELRTWIDGLFPEMPWIAGAPHFAIFIANNRRQRQIHDWRGHAFANDHLDAFFNAAVDAGVALSAFVAAADRLGIGTCPISAVRNHAAAISERVGLPDHVFPICGLTFGPPATSATISPRLPLSATVHRDRFSEDGIEETVAAYDARRHRDHPLPGPRNPERFGPADPYTWSEDKTRQYAEPERADFGAFIRKIGFRLT